MNYQEEQPTKPDLETTLSALRAGENGTLTSTVYYGLSGLQPHEIAQVEPVWVALGADYKRAVLSELLEASETNFDLEYHAIAQFALQDEHGGVRAAAIELLWDDEALDTMQRLLIMARSDADDGARAAALSGLGRFILMDELGEIEENSTDEARQLALELFADETQPIEVRRRALEAVSNCTHDAVPAAIQKAYRSADRLMRVSAVFAMGRSYDERWNDDVLRALTSDDPELRYEAARAAGELELRAALPVLGALAFGEDAEIREIAIWSLGEIGGNDALRVLNKVAQEAEESGDQELLEATEEALHNASLGGDGLLLFDVEEEQ